MRYFEKIAEGIDVAPILAQLEANPQLWDENPMRRIYPNSPHREMTDIWIRSRAMTGEGLASYSEPHESIWNPASEKISAIRDLAPAIMAFAGAHTLGGILVTKIPPGKQIYPHSDKGFWHAEWHDRKAYLCVKTNPECFVWCEDEQVTMREGDCYIFDNQVLHGLVNGGDTDRISVIYAMRRG